MAHDGNADGSFEVSWQSYLQLDSYDIYAQRYSSSGHAKGVLP
jgi:hypothetical protein